MQKRVVKVIVFYYNTEKLKNLREIFSKIGEIQVHCVAQSKIYRD